MQALLWLRRAHMKLKADSRGFSSIVGAIFAVLTMFFLVSTVFVWSLSQNTLYNEAVKQGNQLDLDRLNERVVASAVNYTVKGNIVSVETKLENDGPLSTQIVTLWVLDVNTTKYGFNSSLNINLKPGNITDLSGPKAILVTLAGSSSSDIFRSWFISARGNTISWEKSNIIINNYGNGTGNSTYAMVAGGIGSISMDFKSFRIYKVTRNSTGNFLGPPVETFFLNISQDVAFSINVINLDMSGNDILLTKNSLFWVVSPPVGGGAIKGQGWVIATVVGGKISALGTGTTVLPFNNTATIYFGPDVVSSANIQPGGIVTNLLLVGTVGPKSYGQNLPFVSLIAQDM